MAGFRLRQTSGDGRDASGYREVLAAVMEAGTIDDGSLDRVRIVTDSVIETKPLFSIVETVW